MSKTTNEPGTPNSEAPQGTEGEQGTGSENETPTVETLQAQIEEIKSHSRKWEDRAKANKDAADELAALKRAQMSDDERRSADVEALTSERDTERERADAAEAALARLTLAIEFDLSKEDADALATVQGDEATLRALAERLASRSNRPPKPNPAQGNRGGAPTGTSTADKFADFFDGL